MHREEFMPTILVAGSGQIGSAIAHILSQSVSDYAIVVADLMKEPPASLALHKRLRYIQLDITDQTQVAAAIRQHSVQAVISSLPYFLNVTVAQLAKSLKLHYFDLTEDIAATTAIAKLAKTAETAFVPQCGVAPGFINIVANDLMQHFRELDSVRLRCGALPQQASNALQYALTWSIDGLINEYGNPCAALVNRQAVLLPPLTGLEAVQLDGATYEAFNTSGGLGTLVEIYTGKVSYLNYKTLRYPGHCEKMLFLMNDLKLNEDRETLKKILQNTLPHTQQDVVIVEVTVQGRRNQELVEESYFNKFYPCTVHGRVLTAIQMTTATSACTVVDLVMQNPQKYPGFIHQAQFSLAEFLDNRFGKFLQKKT